MYSFHLVVIFLVNNLVHLTCHVTCRPSLIRLVDETLIDSFGPSFSRVIIVSSKYLVILHETLPCAAEDWRGFMASVHHTGVRDVPQPPLHCCLQAVQSFFTPVCLSC